MGSEADLGVATHNLLDNAIRYTPAGGRVEVGVAVAGRQAVLTVRDTGVGIPSRDLERVFERFYRVDSARSRVTGGTGLGLSIVRHVAETHGGSVAVESELGAGSTFTLELPVGNGQVPGPH
jgi:signal transduction histidine kinase